MDKAFLRAAFVLVTLQHQGAALRCYNCVSTLQPQCRWRFAADHFMLVPTPTNTSVCYMSREKETTENTTIHVITRGFLYGMQEATQKCLEIERRDASNLCQYCVSGDGCNWKRMVSTTTPAPGTGASTTAVAAICTIAMPLLLVIT